MMIKLLRTAIGRPKSMYSKLGIHIKVKSFSDSYAFYKKLGFTPIFAYGTGDFLAMLPEGLPTALEKYRGVTFELGGALFEIGEAHPAVKPEVFSTEITTSKVSAMIDVDSLDDLLRTCKNEGIPVIKGPTEYPWGTTEVVVRDPDGFILVFRELTKEYKEKLS